VQVEQKTTVDTAELALVALGPEKSGFKVPVVSLDDLVELFKLSLVSITHEGSRLFKEPIADLGLAMSEDVLSNDQVHQRRVEVDVREEEAFKVWQRLLGWGRLGAEELGLRLTCHVGYLLCCERCIYCLADSICRVSIALVPCDYSFDYRLAPLHKLGQH